MAEMQLQAICANANPNSWLCLALSSKDVIHSRQCYFTILSEFRVPALLPLVSHKLTDVKEERESSFVRLEVNLLDL